MADAERLNEEELRRLREKLRLTDRSAVSIEEIAEAAGMTSAEVRQALDALRAERAFSSRRRNITQAALLVLAIAMLGLAYRLWSANKPTSLDAKLDAIRHKQEARRQAKLATQTVPITLNARLPLGCTLRLFGPHVRVLVRDDMVETPRTVAQATKLYEQAVWTAYRRLCAEEAAYKLSAPVKPSPDNTTGLAAEANLLVYSSGYSVGLMPFREVSAADAAKTIDGIVKANMDGLAFAQRSMLNAEVFNSGGMMTPNPPPGFSVAIKGRRRDLSSSSSNSIVFVPVHVENAAERLANTVFTFLKLDRDPVPFNFNSHPSEEDKIPMPAYSEVTLKGPSRSMRFVVPTAPSSKYPNAASVERAARTIVTAMAKEAAKQVSGAAS